MYDSVLKATVDFIHERIAPSDAGIESRESAVVCVGMYNSTSTVQYVLFTYTTDGATVTTHLVLYRRLA